MKRLTMTLACCILCVALAACSATAPINMAACASALATTTETDSGKLALLAASNPTCLAASADAINALIAAQASGKAQSW